MVTQRMGERALEFRNTMRSAEKALMEENARDLQEKADSIENVNSERAEEMAEENGLDETSETLNSAGETVKNDFISNVTDKSRYQVEKSVFEGLGDQFLEEYTEFSGALNEFDDSWEKSREDVQQLLCDHIDYSVGIFGEMSGKLDDLGFMINKARSERINGNREKAEQTLRKLTHPEAFEESDFEDEEERVDIRGDIIAKSADVIKDYNEKDFEISEELMDIEDEFNDIVTYPQSGRIKDVEESISNFDSSVNSLGRKFKRFVAPGTRDYEIWVRGEDERTEIEAVNKEDALSKYEAFHLNQNYDTGDLGDNEILHIKEDPDAVGSQDEPNSPSSINVDVYEDTSDRIRFDYEDFETEGMSELRLSAVEGIKNFERGASDFTESAGEKLSEGAESFRDNYEGFSESAGEYSRNSTTRARRFASNKYEDAVNTKDRLLNRGREFVEDFRGDDDNGNDNSS